MMPSHGIGFDSLTKKFGTTGNFFRERINYNVRKYFNDNSKVRNFQAIKLINYLNSKKKNLTAFYLKFNNFEKARYKNLHFIINKFYIKQFFL